jgi:hypothetical protein
MLRPAAGSPDPVTGRVGVLTVLPCEVCGRPVESARGDRRHCSPKCYNRAYNRAHPVTRQRALPLSPPPAPVPPVRDQRVGVADRPRLAGHNLRVLDRLRVGAATNAELAALLGPASAWRTRVSDCRLWLERHEGLTVRAERCLSDGLWLYRIEAIR